MHSLLDEDEPPLRLPPSDAPSEAEEDEPAQLEEVQDFDEPEIGQDGEAEAGRLLDAGDPIQPGDLGDLIDTSEAAERQSWVEDSEVAGELIPLDSDGLDDDEYGWRDQHESPDVDLGDELDDRSLPSALCDQGEIGPAEDWEGEDNDDVTR
ncbi:MAG: hypothetical protein MJD61_12795 [Proteobacteria bacterium]|nr:hypothetical protein [Pseudomonadota bacterium]